MTNAIANSPEAWSPMGAAIADFHSGNFAANIVVKSNVEPDRSMPAEIFFRSFKQFNKLEKLAVKMCKGKVLDVGAGAGAHSLYLQQKGYDVTAIDISEDAANVMRARGLKNAFAADIFSMPAEPVYDSIIMLMNGLGIAGNDEGLLTLLIHLKKMLKPCGSIIADTSDIDYVRPESRERSSLAQLKHEYYGTVYYKLCYKGKCSEVYPWLYASRELVEEKADEAGLSFSVTGRMQEQFLVRLSV